MNIPITDRQSDQKIAIKQIAKIINLWKYPNAGDLISITKFKWFASVVDISGLWKVDQSSFELEEWTQNTEHDSIEKKRLIIIIEFLNTFAIHPTSNC